MNNEYSLELIFSTIKKEHVKNLTYGTVMLIRMKRIVQNKKETNIFYNIIYITGISDKIKNFIKSFKVVSKAYKDVDKLSRFIRVREDRLLFILHKCGVQNKL